MADSDRRRAAVTGLGALSGFGAGAERSWRALVGGERAIRPSPSLAPFGVEVAAQVNAADLPVARDRPIAMALAAAAEAVADAGGVEAGPRLAVAVGTTLGAIDNFLDGVAGRPSRGGWRWSAPAEAIAEAHGAGGAVCVSSVACASGNGALALALDLVRSGRADQVIAGGVDALNDFVCAGFASLKALDPAPCRPFDRARRGLNLGEGACFLVVEEESRARARGARIRAFLDGAGASADANHMTGPDRDGRGALRAMRAALADARLTVDAIDFVSAHGTATPFNDAMEGRALSSLLGGRRVAVDSIKGALGHTLGAAGAFEALLCVRTVESGVIAPTAGLVERDPEIDLDVFSRAREVPVRAALSTSSGFGGLNAAIVVTRYTE